MPTPCDGRSCWSREVEAAEQCPRRRSSMPLTCCAPRSVPRYAHRDRALARAARRLLEGRRIVLLGDSLMGQVGAALEIELLQGQAEADGAWDAPEYKRFDSTRSALSIAKACRLPVRAVQLPGGVRLGLFSVHLRPGMGDGMGAQWATVERALAGGADVVLANFGHHWHQGPHTKLYEAHVGRLAARLAAFRNGSGFRRAMLLETLPQHFPSRDGSGDYDARTAMGPCEARATGDDEPGWRNEVLRRVAAAHGVPVVRAHAALASLHRLHRTGECTHWCYARDLFSPLVEGVWRVVAAGA